MKPGMYWTAGGGNRIGEAEEGTKTRNRRWVLRAILV